MNNIQDVLDICKNVMEGHKEIKDLRSHCFIYQNKIVVIDFSDGYLRFAIDIFPSLDEQGSFSFNLVFRNKETECLFMKKKDILRVGADDNRELSVTIYEYVSHVLSIYKSLYEYEISVIVPVYNREKYISRCVESLNAQTLSYEKFEVIFVDDCSTDKSIEAIKNSVSPYLNYKILERKSNSGGASIPRNDGMSISEGKYLFFVDSDDCLFDYTLKDSLDYINKNNSDVLYIKMISLDKSRSVPVRTYKDGNIAKAEFIINHLCRTLNPIKFYRSSLIRVNDIFFPNYRTNEDRIFSLEAISKANIISILADKAYYNTFNHSDGQLTRKYGLKLEQHMEVCFIFIIKIVNSGLSSYKKNRLFNNMMSVIFDILIAYSKKKSFAIMLPNLVVLKKIIDATGLECDVKLSYPEHEKFLTKFNNYDFYGAWQVSQ